MQIHTHTFLYLLHIPLLPFVLVYDILVKIQTAIFYNLLTIALFLRTHVERLHAKGTKLTTYC